MPLPVDGGKQEHVVYLARLSIIAMPLKVQAGDVCFVSLSAALFYVYTQMYFLFFFIAVVIVHDNLFELLYECKICCLLQLILVYVQQ